MHDTLLYKKNVPIRFIQNKVSEATDISMERLLSHKEPGCRKREIVEARQISMKLSKIFTARSLATIGNNHNGYDHATVLHAIKTVDNLIDTKDINMTDKFWKAFNLVKKWGEGSYVPFTGQTDDVVDINKFLNE